MHFYGHAGVRCAIPRRTAAAGYDIVGVLTKEDQPAGRGQKLVESPVKQLAAGPRPGDPAAAHAAHRRGADRVGRPRARRHRGRGLRPDPATGSTQPASVRLHQRPRLVLPRWRGAAPIAAAILAGEVVAGVSIMRMDAGVDTGPTLSAAYLSIAADDTTGTLTPKLASLGADLLVRTLPRWLAGELTPMPQPDEGVTWAPRITKEEGQIDWSEPAALIERRVRAYQPWPSAYTRWNGLGLKVLRARTEEEGSGIRDQGSGVGSPTGRLRLRSQEPSLRKKPEAREWSRDGACCGWRKCSWRGKRTPIGAFLQGARGFVGSEPPS